MSSEFDQAMAAWQVRRDAWATLLERYADGRQLCNCRGAYYSTGIRYDRGTYYETENDPHCAYGCQAAQGAAKDYIAKRVLEELPPK